MSTSNFRTGRGTNGGEPSSPSSPSSTRAALRQCLTSLGLPSGLLSGVLECHESYDSRLWLLDNSAAMKARDSHVGLGGCSGAGGPIERVYDVTRWEELRECVEFHCSMASRVWMPNKFWFVNSEDGYVGGKNFSICWGDSEDRGAEMANARQAMRLATLSRTQCPLALRIRSLTKSIAKREKTLTSRGKKISVIICTQGVPTDEKGNTGATVVRDLTDAIAKLCKMPVRLIIRLCTNSEKIRNLYHSIDNLSDSIDVLDDYWGEAMEVHLHNPWLTYNYGLHRLRETGLAPDIMANLNERPLSLDEIHQFCTELFLREDSCLQLPLPSVASRRSSISSMNFLGALKFILKKEGMVWNPIVKRLAPWIDVRNLEWSDIKPRSLRNRRKQTEFPSRPRRDPPARRAKNDRRFDKTWHPPDPDEGLTLEEVLQHWSHRPPDYKRINPLQQLLVTVPQTFPPGNTQVEDHEYFEKWKAFDKDAFANSSGDELKELLKRAVRKAKFFLHDDKLPKDLTDNQRLVFKTIWHVIAEREEQSRREH